MEVAREKNIKIMPLCPFAAAMFKKLTDIKRRIEKITSKAKQLVRF